MGRSSGAAAGGLGAGLLVELFQGEDFIFEDADISGQFDETFLDDADFVMDDGGLDFFCGAQGFVNGDGGGFLDGFRQLFYGFRRFHRYQGNGGIGASPEQAMMKEARAWRMQTRG